MSGISILLLLGAVLLGGCAINPRAAIILGPPVLSEGTLYVHGACDVTAYDAKTGAVIWRAGTSESDRLRFCEEDD